MDEYQCRLYRKRTDLVAPIYPTARPRNFRGNRGSSQTRDLGYKVDLNTREETPLVRGSCGYKEERLLDVFG